MLTNQIRQKYLDFFEEKGHILIPSASLVPIDDPSVLFTTAGMHPLVPYLLGQTHPAGNRLVNYQKCVRTVDIENVGDASHLTFFEMLGNWSLGDYFKQEAISWSWQFLTDPRWLGFNPEKIYVTVFAGDELSPRDDESARIWRDLGLPRDHLYFLGRDDNWWGPVGETGPCGPDTEMFFDTGSKKCSPDCRPGCDCGKYIEIWNDVFMEYNRVPRGDFEPLPQKNVDTGLGLARIAMILQKKSSVFETDLLAPIFNFIGSVATVDGLESQRLITDHLRAAAFIIADGVTPSNLDRGYVLRRLIRRAVRHARLLEIPDDLDLSSAVADLVIKSYAEVYPELAKNQSKIKEELLKEENKFEKTLDQGLRYLRKEVQRLRENLNIQGQDLIAGAAGPNKIPGSLAFKLYETYGFPLEMTIEEAEKLGFFVEEAGFEKSLARHRALSKKGAAKKFSGGLAEASPETTRLHTATHLLHQALRQVLGDHVVQKGSNITKDRLRFDFSHPEKLTPEQIDEVEALVNKKINQDLEVKIEEMSPDEAKTQGAMGLFGEKYGDQVKVFSIGPFSKEICAGPHVAKTSELGHFKIIKEQSSGGGVRRIKAVLK